MISGLDVAAGLRVGPLDLAVEFEVGSGEVVGLLGPNGAGKSSVLHLLAGLRPPSWGAVRLNGRRLDDVEEGIHRQPAERRAGVVFQDDLLFPHLSALENVAFGPRARGASASESRAQALSWLRRLHAAELADRRPDELSGGEAQRVALARALATDPELLLLDEPLSALDAQARLDIRRELTRVLSDFQGPAILVTHDPLEAVGLADRLLILQKGRIVQEGSVEEVTRRPRSPWAARLLGLNFFRGEARAGRVVMEGGHTLMVEAALEGPVCGVFDPSRVKVRGRADPEAPRGGDVPAGRLNGPRPALGPSHSSVSRAAGEGSDPTGSSWLAPLAGVESVGHRFRLHLDGPLPLMAETDLDRKGVELLAELEAVQVFVPRAAVRVYPVAQESGGRMNV